jgi:hypothetical protein
MKLPRVRFPVWSLIVAVVVTAVAMGILVEYRRLKLLSRHYCELAFMHSSERDRYSGTYYPSVQWEMATFEDRALRYQKSPNRVMGSYHDQLKSKYERAALEPWRPIEPDPPPPEP